MKQSLEPLLNRLGNELATRPELSALNLLKLARPSVRLITQICPQDQISVGASHIGGLPDFPPGIEWPRWQPAKPRDNIFGEPWYPERPAPLGFIAQINLEELPKIDGILPNSGWLYFFYDRYCEPWGFDPADRGCCRVIYVKSDQSLLKRTPPPVDAAPEHLTQACRVDISAELTLPDELAEIDYGTQAYDVYRELCEELTKKGGLKHHRLLGYPQLIQNPMELECQLVTNGFFCGSPEGYQSTQAKSLAPGAGDWLLLLQIDTDEEGPGWMWGDVGRIYFWIKQDDLASLKFDNVWLILQCY